MRRVECAKGHIYDADVYSDCPYCENFQTVQFGDTAVGSAGETMAGAGVPVGQAGETMPGQGVFVGNAGETQPGRGFSDSMTRPPRGYESRVDRENKTMGMLNRQQGIDPVVGWLVCVEGSEKGKDYRLYGKINTVGRSEKMDVCIHGDPGITRETHARIGYDPRHNNFHLIPANSSNNTYLNDEPVYIPTKLNAYDMLEIGETKLLFVPLCGRKFSWDKGKTPIGGQEDATV